MARRWPPSAAQTVHAGFSDSFHEYADVWEAKEGINPTRLTSAR
jgi:hypothetical protein